MMQKTPWAIHPIIRKMRDEQRANVKHRLNARYDGSIQSSAGRSIIFFNTDPAVPGNINNNTIMSMGDKKKWCSGLVENGAGGYSCKYGHSGPGMQACFGNRYPDGKAPAPCERDDLPFDEARKCVTIKSIKEKSA